MQRLVTVLKKAANHNDGNYVPKFFQRVDRDSSGAVSVKELSAAMRYDLKMELTEKDVEDHFKALLQTRLDEDKNLTKTSDLNVGRDEDSLNVTDFSDQICRSHAANLVRISSLPVSFMPTTRLA